MDLAELYPSKLFRNCPRCGVAAVPQGNRVVCVGVECAFTYYFNPALAAAAFVFHPDGRALFVRRAKEPAKGLLTVPGGFVDVDETAEEALEREVMEEVGLTVMNVRYVCSLTNRYHYKDVTYPVCDLMFRADAVDPKNAMVGDGTAAIEWRELAGINPAELAFPAVRRGLELLRGGVS